MALTLWDILSFRFLSVFEVPSLTSAYIYFAWLAWLFVLSHVVPGYSALGQPIKNREGKTVRLVYTMNGFKIFLISLASYALLIYGGLIPPSLIYDHYGELISFIFLFSFVVSVYLYISGYVFDGVEKNHITGNLLLDFWLGVELNPRFGGLDLKMFALRPGMIGWTMINLSTLAKQYAMQGSIGYRMMLSFLLSFIYVADYFFFEEKMLSTWDIIAEHWGFMLVWADLWFIPVTFSIQGWYLLEIEDDISLLHILLTLLVFIVGYYIFRTSNLEKDQFKNDPEKRIWGHKAKTIDDKLLIDGWWGRMQHPNYVGDILMAISFSLPAGWSYLGAYFYPIYLTILLIHRQMRDDKKCAKKYGALWAKYTKQVPYRLIPGLY